MRVQVGQKVRVTIPSDCRIKGLDCSVVCEGWVTYEADYWFEVGGWLNFHYADVSVEVIDIDDAC